MPSETPGTDSVTSRGTWHCPRRILIMRRASTSLRGALTEAHPRYVSWLNTTLSSSGIGLTGLPSDDDSSAAVWQWIGWGVERRTEKNDKEKAKDYLITPSTILELHINITVLIRDELTCLLQRKNEVKTVGGGIYGYIRTYKLELSKTIISQTINLAIIFSSSRLI